MKGSYEYLSPNMVKILANRVKKHHLEKAIFQLEIKRQNDLVFFLKIE